MTGVADSLSWPFQDPGWFSKILVQGLIALIPIVGWIALAGWMMLLIANYRAGRRELPPAGFHLERGLGIFLVTVVYSIVLALPGAVLAGIGGSARSGGLIALGQLLSFAARLLLAFLLAPIIVATYRGGISGGFDFAGVWQLATANTTNTVLAGVMIFVANLIGGLGFILCCVGLLFTIPYSLAIMAGVATWFEQVSGPTAAPPYPAPPPPPPAAPA